MVRRDRQDRRDRQVQRERRVIQAPPVRRDLPGHRGRKGQWGRRDHREHRHSVMDVSRKTVLIWDASASYTHVAESVVGEFANVLYFVPWEKGFSVARDYIPGMGLDGVERVADFFDSLDRADLVVFTDVGQPGLQEYLRGHGMPVFGSGRAAVLERDRWVLKGELRSAGIDYSDG